MYDLIGDIHGHADELVRLLAQLGYQQRAGAYQHPTRKVIFLGDFIDRGPKIREVLETVRPMVAGGHALAVLGNHELNALAFHTADPQAPGEFLRRHTAKNVQQHQATLTQLPRDELVDALAWFRTLPLWLELDGLRAIHACWDHEALAAIAQVWRQREPLTDAFLASACRPGQPLYAAVEILLKGKECPLPDGVEFFDKDGHRRAEMRTRWYLSPAGQTYRSYALQADEIPCDRALEAGVVAAAVPYTAAALPVFFGHYWLAAARPSRLAANVVCLDYSVAKGGFLCAYRWSGETQLRDENFVWV